MRHFNKFSGVPQNSLKYGHFTVLQIERLTVPERQRFINVQIEDREGRGSNYRTVEVDEYSVFTYNADITLYGNGPTAKSIVEQNERLGIQSKCRATSKAAKILLAAQQQYIQGHCGQ